MDIPTMMMMQFITACLLIGPPFPIGFQKSICVYVRIRIVVITKWWSLAMPLIANI